MHDGSFPPIGLSESQLEQYDTVGLLEQGLEVVIGSSSAMIRRISHWMQNSGMEATGHSRTEVQESGPAVAALAMPWCHHCKLPQPLSKMC